MIKVLRLAIAFIIVAVLLPIIPIPSALAAAEPAITITVNGTDSSKYGALKTGNASGFIYNICVVSTGTTDAITLTASSAGTYAWSTIGNASSEGVSITGDPNAANVTLTIDSTKLLAYNGSAQLQLVTTGTNAGTYTIRFQSTAGVKVATTSNGKFFIEDVNDVKVTTGNWASTSVTGVTSGNGLEAGKTYYANRVGKLTNTGTQYDKQVRVTFVPDTGNYIKSVTVDNAAVPVLTSTSAETFQYILLGTPEDGLTSSVYNVAVTFAAGYPVLTAESGSTYEHTVFDPAASKIADTYDVYYVKDKLDTTNKITLTVDAAATLAESADCTFAAGVTANTGTFTLTNAGSASTTTVVATGKISLGAKEYTIRFIPVAAYTVSVTGNGTANVKDNGTGNNTASSDTTTTINSFVGSLGETVITLTPTSGNIVKSLKVNSSANLVDGTSGVKTYTLTADSEFYEIEVEFAKPVTGISLDITSATLTLLADKNTETLVASITPHDATNKSVTWASSNINIATVDANGLVTAVGAGTTTITVTTVDGNHTATCAVTVLPTFTVTYLGNANTGGTAPSNSSYASGTSVTVSSNTGSLTKTDHTFDGWNTQADGQGDDYAVGRVFPITSNITLYAKWATISVSSISLKTSTSLPVGDTETLTPTFTPTDATNKNVTWSSDSTGVATVSQSGVVIAASVGTAKITVKTQDGGFEATCTVTVTAAPPTTYPVTVVNGTGSGNYTQGAAVTITAGTPPTGQQFKNWTSTSPGVSFANASSASTTFVMPANTVTVTANFENIPSSTVSVTGVTLNKTSTTLVAGTTETLTATVAPSGATNNSVTWASSNTSIASVTNGVVTAVGVGTTTITVTTVDGNKTAVCTVSVIAVATTYSVTVVNGTGSGNYAQGSIVGITANAAPAGYRFLNWTSTNTSINYVNANSATTSFPMPASAVTVTANYILLSQTTDVTYTAVQIGGTSGTADSTGIKITFNQAVTGLTMNDITVTNGTGAVVQSTLSGSSTIYTIKLTSVTKQGKVTIDIGTFGPYNVKTAAQSVDVYKNAAANSNGSFKYGDLSGKGYVDNSDLILMLRYFMQSSLSIDLNAADINGDGVINNADLVLLLKYFARPGTVLGPQ